MLLNTLKIKSNNVMSSYKDTGEKSDESTSDASASFTCEECGKTFNSRQELKEHTH
jgi:Zinc-finger of C2H2 type